MGSADSTVFIPFVNPCKLKAMDIIKALAKSQNLKEQQVQNVLDLLNEGGTIPFIARYRKEMTGSLNEDQLRAIEQGFKYQSSLQERKESILGILEEKQLLNDALRKSIEDCETLAQLEDVYRPYKEKRKTKASDAIAAGWQPAADEILAQKKAPEEIADDEGLVQCGYILAEQISDDPEIRKLIKENLLKNESLVSVKKKDAEDPSGIYETYYEFSNRLNKVPGYRVMALDRGEKEKVLSVSISSDLDTLETRLARRIVKNRKSETYLRSVIRDSLSRLILPSIKREIRAELREAAHENAIAGFSSNLEHLLMTRPVKGQVILAWDPGYRNGCKLAVLDAQGELLETRVVHPFAHGEGAAGKAMLEKAKSQTQQLIDRWHPTLIVIGNGTASRESVDLIAQLLKSNPGISYVIGSEAGASVYSASPAAKEEFPDLPVEERSAVSIGRRVQDPLSELVKIDPQALGIGEYQHDVSAKKLKEALDFVTDKAVNRVGVNVNTASEALLKHVAGLKKPQIAKILAARKVHPFTSREQLAKILPPKAYEQSIGFLRIPAGDNPLDNTGIHPESYQTAYGLLKLAGLTLDSQREASFGRQLMKIRTLDAARQLNSDAFTLQDIIVELMHPGLDPRDKLDGPVLKTGVLKIEDLTPGMKLEGTVRNVTSFGAFVDIGLHEDGLVHISKLSSRYVSDPKEVVHTGQIVQVTVLETDLRRKRISLSMTD